jgi:hypothetical protein
MKYQVVGLVDAVVYEEVDASSPEDAASRANLSASVCHQCAGELEVGDVWAVRVLDESGVEVYSDESAQLHLATVEELRAELARRTPLGEVDDA